MYSEFYNYSSFTLYENSIINNKENYKETFTIKKLVKNIIHIRPSFLPSLKWSCYDSIITQPESLLIIPNPTIAIITSTYEKWSLLNSQTIIYTYSELYKTIKDLFPNHEIRTIDFNASEENNIYSICQLGNYSTLYWTFPSRGIAKMISYHSEANQIIPSLILIQQFYIPREKEREKEINFCLQKNINHPYIDQIILLNESDDITIPYHSTKIKCKSIGKRMKYSDVYQYIKENVPRNTICLYGNSDMYIGEIRDIFNTKMKNTFLALLRWDITNIYTEESKIDGNNICSQDIWGILSDDVHNMTNNDLNSLDFNFGVPGCDNIIITLMKKMGLDCYNPAYTLKTYHVHLSNIRNYTEKNRLQFIEYSMLQPCAFI